MAEFRIPELTTGDHTATSLVWGVQGGADRQFTLNTAAFKAAAASGSGAAGQVPLLDSAGVLAVADGGTGLSAGPTAAGQYFGTPQGSTTLGWYALPTVSLNDGQVSTAKLADAAVVQAKLADDSVGADQLIDASVGSAALAADAVTGAKVADAAIDSEHLADGAVGADQLDVHGTPTDDQVIAWDAANSRLRWKDDATGAAASLAAGSIAHSHLAADCVEADNVADDAIGAAAIADGAVVSAAFAAGAVNTAALGADAVTGAKVADGAIDTEHLAADCVVGGKVADDAIDTEHIADSAIVFAHIDAGAATDGQLLSASVSGGTTVLDWIDPPGALAYATRAELRTGESNETKVVNPKTLAAELSSIRRQFDDLWSGFLSAIAEGTITGASTSVAPGAPAPSVSAANVTSGDSETITLAAGDIKTVSSACTNLPELTGHEFSIGLTFLRGAGDRWMLGLFRASGASLATVYRWFRLESDWVEATDPDDFTYEPLSVQGGYWQPLAADAESLPGALSGGTTGKWLAQREQRWLRFVSLRQHNATSWRLPVQQRTLGWIEDELYSNDSSNGLTDQSNTSLITGRKFSDYENLYVVTRSSGGYDYQHGMVSGNVVKDNTTELACWAGGHGVNMRLNDDTTFRITGRTDHGVKKIIGRRQFP